MADCAVCGATATTTVLDVYHCATCATDAREYVNPPRDPSADR